MKKILQLIAVLAIAIMLTACGTIQYTGNTDKKVQAVACEVISIEEPVEVVSIEETAPEPAAAPITITKIREAIMFPFDSSEITDDEMVKVDKIADILKEYPDTYIVINGWASIEGTESYNMILSTKRAMSVQSALIEKGIDQSRIEVVGKGETNLFGELLKVNRRAIVLDVE